MKNIISGNRKKNKAPVVVAVVLCAVSMFSIAMIYKTAVKKQQDTKELVETENTQEDIMSESEEENQSYLSENGDNGKIKYEPETETVGVVDGSRQEETAPSETEAAVSRQVNYFSENNILTWPVRGEILMEYSMDKPIYFSTLEQYGYLNGVIIQAERGMPVYTSADGTVTSVEYTDQYGWTVTIDMGNGYNAIYGQLADIKVSEGDNVITGSVVAEVAVPSKFYSLEGDNIYFALKKDENYIDPLDYLE